MMTRYEVRRDEAEFAQYLRHCEEGYEGTFVEWLSERVGTAPTEPPAAVEVEAEEAPF